MRLYEFYGNYPFFELQLKDFQKEKSSLQSAMKLLDDDKGTWVAEKTALKNEVFFRMLFISSFLSYITNNFLSIGHILVCLLRINNADCIKCGSL